MEKTTQLCDIEKDIRKFVRKLKKKEIYYNDIPEKYRLHPKIIKIQRELGIRKSWQRGYDIIRSKFFVDEIVLLDSNRQKHIDSFFPDFASYYEFLVGDIYENACYFQYDFTQEEIDVYNIDLDRVNTISFNKTTFTNYTIVNN